MSATQQNHNAVENPFSLTVDQYGRLWLHTKAQGVPIILDLAERVLLSRSWHRLWPKTAMDLILLTSMGQVNSVVPVQRLNPTAMAGVKDRADARREQRKYDYGEGAVPAVEQRRF